MSRGHSLRWQLLGAMTLIFTLGVLASLGSYQFEVRKLGDDLRTRTLEEQARELRAELYLSNDGRIQVELSPAWRRAYADEARHFTYTVYDQTGRLVAMSPNLDAPLPFSTVPSGQPYGPVNFMGVGPDRQVAITTRGPEDYVLVVARRNMGRDTLVDSLFEEDSEQLLVLGPFAVLALGFIWLITWASLHSITRASREASAIGPANPGLRISSDGLPREIQPLVAAANGALNRLADAYARERRMTADAAHALRTPLAVLSLRLQRARHSGTIDWPAVERDLAEVTGMVRQLLDLARKESLAHHRDLDALPIVNLSRIVREAAATIVPLIEGQGRQLDVNVPETLPFRGHADDLRDLVRNLLENALWHGRGNVSVEVRRGKGVTIAVADEGDGVPIGMEEDVFERFRKEHADSPGAGLGLAIVRQVARSHGGDARFERGRGRVIVFFPEAHGDRSSPSGRQLGGSAAQGDLRRQQLLPPLMSRVRRLLKMRRKRPANPAGACLPGAKENGPAEPPGREVDPGRSYLTGLNTSTTAPSPA